MCWERDLFICSRRFLDTKSHHDNFPNPNEKIPIHGVNITYIKPTTANPNIIAGDFTYFADKDFEAHVKHHYDFIGDKLIIGKFCQIAAGVEFVMNGANHQMNAITTYPFYIFGSWNHGTPTKSQLPIKGDTVINNDVWIGQNVTLLPGVHAGDGVIIGLNSTVASNLEPHGVYAGITAKLIHKRFDDEMIDLLLRFKWWDKSIDEIRELVPILTCSDTEKVRHYLASQL